MQIPIEIVLLILLGAAVWYGGVQRVRRLLAERRSKALEKQNEVLSDRWLSK